MRTRIPRWPLLLGALTVALGLAAPARAGTFVALTDDNKLRTLNSAAPGSPGPELTITGLQMGETIHGIDFRPENSLLYGLGSTNRLYVINPNTGAATTVGSPGGFTLAGTDFGTDFNPVPDHLRVVSDADQNMRVNPDNGMLAGPDTPLSYRVGDINFGMNPNVVASAYTNNFYGAGSTTLYGIDSGLDVLTMQNPPDSGMLATMGPLGFNFSGLTGFDVLDDGTAFATSAGTSASTLYGIDLATGQATVLGTVPDVLRGLAGEPTGAAGPFSGQLNRLAGNQLRFDVSNDGMRPIEFLAFDLNTTGFAINQVDIVSGPSAQCDPIPQSSAAQCGPFPGPSFWPGGGQGLGILFETDSRYPDGGGVDLFVCAARCFPFFRDDGPFSFGGPFAVQQPPGPGGGVPPIDGGDNGIPGDFDLNGAVDAADYLVWRRALLTENGVRVRIQTPDGVLEGDAETLYNEWRANFGRTGASAAQRRRAKAVVFARGRPTLRGGQSRRVRIRLTKAGKRLVRGYQRKRLRATFTLRVTHRPASGAPVQRRTFKQKVTLRVKRKRR